MALAWELALPATEKLVLLALADWSNDAGLCWPSIKRLQVKTGLSERGIQNAVKSLCAAGHLTRQENPGNGVNYLLHPRTTCTPAADAPPHEVHHTPAPRAPNTPRYIIPSDDKSSSGRARKVDAFPMPDGIDPQHWQDFLTNRKQKRTPNTATAHKRLLADLARLADEEWPPGRLIEHAAERGWAAIYDPRQSNGNATNGTANRKHRQTAGKEDGFLSAIRHVANQPDHAQWHPE